MTSFKHILIFFLVIIRCLTFAQILDVNIVVINSQGKKFTLYVNDQKINNEPQVNVKAFHINEGWCKLKAEFEEDKITANDSIRIKPIEKNNNKEITLSLEQTKKNNETKAKFDFLYIGELSGPQTPVVPELPAYMDKHTDGAIFGNLYKITGKKVEFITNYDSLFGTCKIPLNDKDIECFLLLIERTNDFTSRVRYTEQTVLNNCYTSSQLNKILNTLEIEMDKLKLSKKGYYHILDKQNAKAVEAIFKFKTMNEDYANFLIDVAQFNHQKALNCTEPVGETQFNELYVSIVKVKYEHDKITLAKKIASNNCFSTAQTKKILDIFTHDREKLEFVKIAYPIITDKENCKTLSDCFLFSENKKDYLNFLPQ